MTAIIFVSVFFGSLSAAALVFSGWPLWFACFVYLSSGLIGIGMMLAAHHIRPALSRSAEWITHSIPQLKFWKQNKLVYLEVETVPDLSEYLFHSTRNRK